MCTQSDGFAAVPCVFVVNACTVIHVKDIYIPTGHVLGRDSITSTGLGLTTKKQQANHNGTGLLHADQSSVDRQSLTTLGQGGDGGSIRSSTWPCRPKELLERRIGLHVLD